MSKKVLFETKAREKMIEGIDTVCDAVKITLGPRGRNVAIANQYGAPRITNDGRTIADAITLHDPFENMGAEFAKDCARKTDREVGDATSTTLVLLQAVIEEGTKYMKAGTSPMKLREGIEIATEKVIAELKAMAVPVDTKEMLEQVATVSVENPEIGKIIANVIWDIGPDGVITVEEHEGDNIETEIVDGMQFDKGCISPVFLTDFERMVAEYKDVHILITDKKLLVSTDILYLFEKMGIAGYKNLVIIADEIDGEALKTFELNRGRGLFNVLGVRAPGTMEQKRELLQDIAIKVGATVVDDNSGINLATCDIDILGKAKIVKANQFTTTIIGGEGDDEKITDRANELKSRKENTLGKYEKSKLDERIARLIGKVGVVKVGATTDANRKYLKDKIDDAVNSTKRAREEGIVPGGGTALMKAGRKVVVALDSSIDPEILTGMNILLQAVILPLAQIAKNAGKMPYKEISEWVNKGGDYSGYNALTNKFIDDMVESGIIDPLKTERIALQNASVDGALFLTTDVAIADKLIIKKQEENND